MTNSSKLNLWRELLLSVPLLKSNRRRICQQHHVRVHQFYYWREKAVAFSSRE